MTLPSRATILVARICGRLIAEAGYTEEDLKRARPILMEIAQELYAELDRHGQKRYMAGMRHKDR